MLAQGKHAECIRDYVAFKNATLLNLLFDFACDEQVNVDPVFVYALALTFIKWQFLVERATMHYISM